MVWTTDTSSILSNYESSGEANMAEISDVSDDSFEQDDLRNERPVLVEFWGDQCPACRQISPILHQLAEERSDALEVAKIHAAENPATSAQYGVLAMPTVLAFASGTVRGRLVGPRPKSAFVELLEQLE